MRKLLSWLLRILGTVAGLVLLIIALRAFAMHRFAAGWQKRFPEYKENIDSLPAVDLRIGLPGESPAPEPMEDAKLVKCKFADGSWFIVAQHDTHDEGLEWDRAVFYDSRGGLRLSKHHFCGWEGLMGELREYGKNAQTLDDFYQAAGPIL